jgi:uncharacterized protein YjbI with pentapeptide repeats
MTRPHHSLSIVSWLPWILSIVILSLGLFGLIPAGVNGSALAANYAKTNLVDQDFSGQDLRDSTFNQANLLNGNLSHTDLRGVSLFGANLKEANLEGADLRDATLDLAGLIRANLTNARLEGAFAYNAKFEGAIVDGADFTDVDLRRDAQSLLCQVAKGANPVTGRETRATLNCD